MRTARIVTHRRCNQNCPFCTERRASDDRSFIERSAVDRRIDDALSSGARDLVVTGGEPTLRHDLASILERARGNGARIVLETNGAQLTLAILAAVDLVRLHVPGWGPALTAITRDHDAPAILLAALRVLVASEASFEIATPIVRSNVAVVRDIPAGLVAEVGHAATAMVLTAPVASPDPNELLSFDELADAIVEIDAEARKVGLAVRLADGSGPPPCVFEARRRPSHLYALSGRPSGETDHEKLESCATCRIGDACPGVSRAYLGHFPVPNVHPVADDRGRRRLALIGSVEEQIARELVSRGGRAHHPGEPPERIVRIQFHCNQACDFCFVSTHLPPPRDEAVLAAIDDALAAGERIAISGGEPTLNPRLPEYLRRATESRYPVEVQTNAVRLDDRILAETLVAAGLSLAFVSLHGATPEVSDAVTRARGTFQRTVRGLDNLALLGVSLRLNFVICRSNIHELPAVVDLIAARWPGAVLSVSFVARSTDVVPRDPEFLPRYSDVAPFVAEALARAHAHDLRVEGFESMCGLPLCVVPTPAERHFALPELTADDRSTEFERPEPCTRCALATRCFGVRRGYVEAYGFSELRPLEAVVAVADR